MGILDGLLQGIIQGLTEFLPISSSGHLSLYQYFTGTSGEGSLFFNLMLHLGTLAAIIAAYYEDLWAMLKQFGQMVKELFTGKFTFKTENADRKMIYMLFVACLPMVLVIPLRGLVGRVSGDKDIIVEGVCFLVTAGLLFAACKARRGKAGIGRMKVRHAAAIGVMQAVATMPGISRSGATISTGLVLGFDRAFMVKFSFLLGIPAIVGGAVFEIGDAAKEKADIQLWPLFFGMLAAALVGYVCIRLVRWLLLSDRFIIFAWYTLVLGVAVVVIGIIGHLSGGEPSAAGQAASDVSRTVSDAASALGGL
ncbi:MAG: undecaprenyl-diphosphate phosphatase [Oscillospiraceae bacterium]